jgi:hypothetical protein
MESRWFRRLGPGVAALGAMAAVASTTVGAPVEAPSVWQPPPCVGSPAVASETMGAWFRLDPILVEGEYVGQWLSLGRPDGSDVRRLELDRESFATGPSGGSVLMGTDDGGSSELALIDILAGCRWSVGSSRDVVRNAVLDPAHLAIVESRVDRRTRADLGIWRRPLDGGAAVAVLPPIPADERFGPTWRTDLAWSEDGSRLAVGSCGEAACRYRLVSRAGGSVGTIADPTLGVLVGIADGWLVARGACRGLPCPIVSVSTAGDDRVTLDDAAGIAVMARGEEGRSVVVQEFGSDRAAIRSIHPDGHDARPLSAPPVGMRLVPGPTWAAGAVEHPDDMVAFGRDGRVAGDASPGILLRSLSTDVTASPEEMSR